VHTRRALARHTRVAGAEALIGWLVLILAGWGLGALTVATTRSPDLHAVRDLVSDRTAPLTAVAHGLSFIGSGYVIIPLALVITIVLFTRGDKPDAYAIVLSVAGAMALSALVKVIVDRARPPVHHLESVSSASFPSGHATQSTACFLALLLVWLAARPAARGRTVAATATTLLIAAVALSRVYLGVHYPTDVIAGILLGGAWALLTRRLLCGSTGPAGR
jgi:undecaprenyl-diphosphatase